MKSGNNPPKKKRCFDGYISTPVDIFLLPSGPVLEPGGFFICKSNMGMLLFTIGSVSVSVSMPVVAG